MEEYYCQTKELTLEEYAKALKKARKTQLISIALYHIQKVRDLETLIRYKPSGSSAVNTNIIYPYS